MTSLCTNHQRRKHESANVATQINILTTNHTTQVTCCLIFVSAPALMSEGLLPVGGIAQAPGRGGPRPRALSLNEAPLSRVNAIHEQTWRTPPAQVTAG